MADAIPRRTETSSTLASEAGPRDTEDPSHKQPLTPVRTRADQRRVTLSHRKLVFYDPVAFRYLEEDESTIVLARRERLKGYELYIVEQWVCSRVHPTFVITTYTGDPSHSILVNVLAVPHDENNWSKRLKTYFEAVSKFQAREQETTLGTLMVTNLSAFPSTLTVIGVPDGDVKKHREDFIVNENLKRMGCAGRAAMNLQKPPPTTMTKFQHLYQTSESIPFETSVMELVRLCQTALVLYGKLELLYADGLLCDITENALQDWWNDIGTDFHNVEPSDGVLGPTTVSALVGLMIGAYHRIRATGITVPKDVLDVTSMKRAIGHFQKAYKVNKTRRLDRDTLDRLHRVTAKTANSDGWAVPRAVKSTVAELSGKGGEMVMGAIGANKEKIAISEMETLDIDKLAQIVPSGKMKWLWQGKPLKSNRGETFSGKDDDDLNNRIAGADDHGNYRWIGGTRESATDNNDNNDAIGHDKSGLRRLKGAVGIPSLRTHNTRSHKHGDELSEKEDNSTEPKMARTSKENLRPDHLLRSPTSVSGRPSFQRQLSDKPAIDLELAAADPEAPIAPLMERVQNKLQAVRSRADSSKSYRDQLQAAEQPLSMDGADENRVQSELRRLRDEIQADHYQKFATEFEEPGPDTQILRRSKSSKMLIEIDNPVKRYWSLPRQLSFSLVEANINQFPNSADQTSNAEAHAEDKKPTLRGKMSSQKAENRILLQLARKIRRAEQDLLPFTDVQVRRVEVLDAKHQEHLSELNSVYYQRLDEYQSMQATSRDIVTREKATINDGLRKIDMLGQKLDYELDALQSRMQEVEDSAADFERNVIDLEARVASLVRERQNSTSQEAKSTGDEQKSWYQRALNFFQSSSRASKAPDQQS